MPTILKWRGWAFLFYSADGSGPPHVHVRKGRQEVKFWLEDVSVAGARRVPERELRLLQRKVAEQQTSFLEAWHAHLG